ncbi:MAG: exodeoxyribonuclease V subunit alpha [Propionibacteriaceae bacterium]|jgi:exodeoxyribonuclease V alpha subunit|nr:exodeoxyribonuclease V subunit alpha [Propionibacteriaceae bacterium]
MTQLAKAATGLLGEFHARGLLGWAGVHAATKWGWLYGERDELALLGAAAAVQALQHGSTCLDLGRAAEQLPASTDQDDLDGLEFPEAQVWQAALESSPLVSVGVHAPSGPPLRLVSGLLYLQRYWAEEQRVEQRLQELRAAAPLPAEGLRPILDGLFPPGSDPDQRLAAAVGALSRLTVIAGGPGTGKTHTIARLIAAWQQLHRGGRIALAAPTGKAAARMLESLQTAAGELPTHLQEGLAGIAPTTIHRLLGWSPAGRMVFTHDALNPLPFALVVIDEASMVSLTLMSRLLAALPPNGQLVLVGDPEQLTSVEAGAVLADIAELPLGSPSLDAMLASLSEPPSPTGALVRLRHNHRSGGTQVDAAARAVQAADAAELGRLAEAADGVFLLDPEDPASEERLRALVLAAALPAIAAARDADGPAALAELRRHQILCAHREGRWGVSHWGARAQSWIAAAAGIPAFGLFPGQPLIYTANSPEFGLSNGDPGVVIRRGGELLGYFGPAEIPAELLHQADPAFAFTVHKAQGSQFEAVSLILPPPESPLANRELLYTALTRAERQAYLFGSEAALSRCVEHRAVRASGLAR